MLEYGGWLKNEQVKRNRYSVKYSGKNERWKPRGNYTNHRCAVGCVDDGRGGDVNKSKLRDLEFSLKTRVEKDKKLIILDVPNSCITLVPMARIQANETTLQEFYMLFKDELM